MQPWSTHAGQQAPFSSMYGAGQQLPPSLGPGVVPVQYASWHLP